MKVKIKTSLGEIVAELDAVRAPKTVENFLAYVNDGFFDGTIFHRVIKDFMIQGGGFEPELRQKSARAVVENEADNGLSNLFGTLAMARTGDPHSASAQFFINVKDNPSLNHTAPTNQGWGYCVFGAVTEGQDVINNIAEVPTATQGGMQDVPVDDVMIDKVEVLEE